jgi:hypothetical protein
VRRDQLCVTEGAVAAGPDGALTVDDDKMRAVAPNAQQPTAEAQFTYVGPTAQTSALGSGEVRRQFGLKLRAQDPCNLVYAMWRFEPASEVVVQVKRNPGMSTSSACGNNGYSTVRPQQTASVAAPAVGSAHRLAAEIDGSALTIRVDGAPVWQGDLGASAAPESGPVGMRSDNVRLSLAFLAAAGDAPAGQCPAGGGD